MSCRQQRINDRHIGRTNRFLLYQRSQVQVKRGDPIMNKLCIRTLNKLYMELNYMYSQGNREIIFIFVKLFSLTFPELKMLFPFK